VHARRIALGDRTPVVLANLGSDRDHLGSLASESPVLVVLARSGRPLEITIHECKIIVLVCRLPWREQTFTTTTAQPPRPSSRAAESLSAESCVRGALAVAVSHTYDRPKRCAVLA
jgi:hypothetical protein